MTLRKTIDQQRRLGVQKRGGGHVRGESVFARAGHDDESPGFQQFSDLSPSPQLLVMLEEEGKRLLEQLEDETLRQVAVWRLEGFTNDEIAGKLGLTTRSVERKLHRIREKWSQVDNT